MQVHARGIEQRGAKHLAQQTANTVLDLVVISDTVLPLSVKLPTAYQGATGGEPLNELLIEVLNLPNRPLKVFCSFIKSHKDSTIVDREASYVRLSSLSSHWIRRRSRPGTIPKRLLLSFQDADLEGAPLYSLEATVACARARRDPAL